MNNSAVYLNIFQGKMKDFKIFDSFEGAGDPEKCT